MKHVLSFYHPKTEFHILDIILTPREYEILKEANQFDDDFGCYPLEVFVEDDVE